MGKKTIKRFKKMVKPYTGTIIFVAAMALLIDICELIKPLLIKEIMEKYLPQKVFVQNGINIGMIFAAYILLVIVGNLFDYINRIITSKMGEKVVYNLRAKLYKYIGESSVTFHDKTPSGKLFVRIVNDTEDVYSLFSDVITTFPKDIIIVIGLLMVMLYLSVKLSVVNLIIVPLLLIVSIIISRVFSKIYSKIKETRTILNTFLAESIYGIKLIKIFNRQKEKQAECEKYTKSNYNAAKGLGFTMGILPASMDFIQNLGTMLIVVFCANRFMGIELNPSIVYLFVSYLNSLFEPISRIVENVEIVEDAFSSIDKIYEVLEHEEFLEDYESGIKLENVKGKIEFKHVWFAYDEKNWVLKDVNFTINPGESIALVGKTGSGKTTITNLINRFYNVQKGEILLDGVNIKDINIKSLRKSIGTILQDPFIYAKTMKENIKMFENLDDGKIEEAIEMSSATEFVKSLKNGINEIASERGNSYSAGQKQLIAFARIFAKNPSIFILDEATANIDTKTEQLIQKSVEKISKEKTSIFIAHRLSTIVNVDKIFVLDKGKIIEEGNHETLIKKEGYYSKLYNAYYNSLVL